MGIVCSVLVCDDMDFSHYEKNFIAEFFYNIVYNDGADTFLFGKTKFELTLFSFLSKLPDKAITKIHLRETYSDILYDIKEFDKLKFDKFSYIDNTFENKVKNSDIVVFCISKDKRKKEVEKLLSYAIENHREVRYLFYK